MKKLIITLAAIVCCISANAQVNTNRVSPVQFKNMVISISSNIVVNVTTNSDNTISYAVTLQPTDAAKLLSLKLPTETDEEYVKRAFVIGVLGLKQQREMISQQITILSQQASLVGIPSK